MTTETPQPGFDVYTIRARLAPALMTVAPALALGIAVLPLLPGAYKLWSLLSVGLVTYAALVARKAGNRVQPELWEHWGGAPTARRLRYRENPSPAETTRRHRDFERALGASHALPSEAEEMANPQLADAEYQQAARRLISKVRNDNAFPLLITENRNYGFARNLYGLKPLGVTCAFVVLASSAVAALIVGVWEDWSSASPLSFPILVACTALVLWRQVDADYVKPAADAYADRVLEAAQRLAEGLTGR